MSVRYAVECLKKERESLLEKIKNGEHIHIQSKVEIENAIRWLEKIIELELGRSKQYDFIKLPDMNMGY
jgi:hypothetical protein